MSVRNVYRSLSLFAALLTVVIAGAALPLRAERAPGEHANVHDIARSEVLRAREADWRNGAIVYQVIVDRFVPSADLDAKRHLYPPPKRLRSWDEVPRQGTFNDDVKVWTHEIDFWGGDLESLLTELDYIADLGVDVLYLNPIHDAYTNHKYDARDYMEVSPEYGTREDVEVLAGEVHARGMRLVLDGVLNHKGRTSPRFRDALENPDSPYRDWFYIGPEYAMGYRGWYNVPSLPEINLENPEVQAYIYGDFDSVIQSYLRMGVDGWRLDVAFDIGFHFLHEITKAAQEARPGSLIVGEIWNYPEEWFPSIDGIMNMTARQIIFDLAQDRMSGAHAAELLHIMIEDAGLENMLRSWVIIDNHDTPRLRTMLGERWQQRIAQVLQFTIPGSPCVYYGVELGMEGGHDPEMRAPMRWDLVGEENEHYVWMRDLIALRQSQPALRIGDYRPLASEHVLAFLRRTDRVEETVVVVVNPSGEAVSEVLMPRESKFMSYMYLEDAFTGERVQIASGLLPITVPPRTAWVLLPVLEQPGEYTPFKRVQ